MLNDYLPANSANDSILKLPNHIPVWPLGIMFIYLALAIGSVQFDDITYDEQDHLNYGVAVLSGQTGRQAPGRDFNTTMPVTALNALPRAVQQVFHPGLEKTDGGSSDTRAGRYVTIAITLLLLLYGYLFAKALAGETAGLLAMLLLATDPNIIAHSRLVTTDIYGTIAFLATIFHIYCWRIKGSSRHFYYWAVALAVSVCCKINNVLLYPVSLLIILFTAGASPDRPGKSGLRIFSALVFFFLIQALVINTCFLWNGFGFSFKNETFSSHFFLECQKSFAASWPVPLPLPFVRAFDLAQYERESFAGTALNYLAGELRYKQGFWNYYFVCWLLKTPILTQAAIIFGLFRNLGRRPKIAVLFWIVPALAIFLLLSFSDVQSGYRYLLPVTSISLVFTGTALRELWERRKTRWLKWSLAALVIPLISGFPNFIAYSNWLIPDKTHAYRWLADSNLNWGQRDRQVKEYVARHPEIRLNPEKPVSGLVLVDINAFTGIVQTEKYAWLRQRYQPIGQFGQCYLLFNIPGPGH